MTKPIAQLPIGAMKRPHQTPGGMAPTRPRQHNAGCNSYEFKRDVYRAAEKILFPTVMKP